MKQFALTLTAIALCLLSGCASYQASALSALDPIFIKEAKQVEGMAIGCKEFTKQDCLTYLDRDVIKKGFQPIQLTFHNQSDKTYLFSVNGLGLPIANPDDVAAQVHTSTVTRVASYTAGALLLHPLIIPAIVDGICSSKANKKLDQDFSSKIHDHILIMPDTFEKTLAFIPCESYSPLFDLILIELDSGEPVTVRLSAQR